MKFLVAILSVAFAAQGLSYCKAPQKDMLGSMCTKLSGLTTAKYLNSACEGYIGEKGCQTTCCKIYTGKGQKTNAGGSTQKHSRWSRYTRHSHGNQNGNKKGFWKNQYDHDRQSRGNQQRGRGSYGRHSTHSRHSRYGHEDGQSKGRYSEYGRGTSKYNNGQSRYSRWSHHRGTSSRGHSSRGHSSHGYPSRHGSSSHHGYSRHGSRGQSSRGQSSHGYSRHGQSHGYSRHGQSSRGGYSRGGYSRGQDQEQGQSRGHYNQYGHGGH